MKWRTDRDAAPKDGETKILILLTSGDITTGCFYWYTENDHESFSGPIAYWCLQDMVRDVPLDEDGPPETSEMKWAAFPC